MLKQLLAPIGFSDGIGLTGLPIARRMDGTLERIDRMGKKGRETPGLPRKMWRINFLAHRFVDRKKEGSRRLARGRSHKEMG